MLDSRLSRRRMLKSSLAFAGAAVFANPGRRAEGFAAANERPRIGAVGTGSRWYIKATGVDGAWGSAPDMRRYGDYVALCDADAERRERAAELAQSGRLSSRHCTMTIERSSTTPRLTSFIFQLPTTGMRKWRSKRCWRARTSISRSR